MKLGHHVNSLIYREVDRFIYDNNEPLTNGGFFQPEEVVDTWNAVFIAIGSEY